MAGSGMKIRDDEGGLPEAFWRARLLELADDCRDGGAAGEADRIREAWNLLALAPRSGGIVPANLPAETTLEAMLGVRARESAALALLPEDAGYMISCGAGGVHMASIFLPGAISEHTAEAGTVAMALIAALAEALAAGGTAPMAGGEARGRLN